MGRDTATVPGAARLHIAGGDVRSEPVDVVLGDVEVHESAVDADTDIDVESEARSARRS